MIDPELKIIICENCSTEHHINESHSMLIVLQKSSVTGSSFFQCDKGNEHNTLTFQHWNCSSDCMKISVLNCIDNHFQESDLQNDPNVNFHRLVSKSEIYCKNCYTPLLNHDAYRFCLTVATPFNYILGESMNDLGEWCCSLSCAKERAKSFIQ